MHRCCVVGAAVVALVAPFAGAQITEEDDLVFGTGSITRDSAQQLDFLDVPLSIARSYDDVSSQFGVGGDFEGWRHATLDEVVTLVNNWGFSPTVPDPVPGITVLSLNQDGSGVALGGLTSRLGHTVSFGGTFSFTLGFTEIRDAGVFLPYVSMTASGVFSYSNPSGPASVDTAAGHYLVRDVPAPGALALFGTVALAGVRRRR